MKCKCGKIFNEEDGGPTDQYNDINTVCSYCYNEECKIANLKLKIVQLEDPVFLKLKIDKLKKSLDIKISEYKKKT